MGMSEDFPYVEGKDGTESQEHVKLKGLAVYWLLQRGFQLENIQEEYVIMRDNGGRGDFWQVDVYAEQDNVEIFIECERGPLSFRNIGKGAQRKAENGKWVMVFAPDGIYKTIEFTPDIDHLEPSVTEHRLEYHSNLPMLDLSAFG